MSINLTMLGQLVSFVLFVLFCMKFVWPPLTEIMRQRQKDIAEGLEKAAAAEAQLADANSAAEEELEEAKKQAAELIAQANARASQIVEEAKAKAGEEGERILADAQSKIEQEVNQAREALRAQVSVLAVEGAEKILEASVDREAHQDMLNKLAASL
ncbi:MAG: F0F1 ATP synthase subunit B [Gammaproteobacteria bacterium]|nr:F0F1 ATP synthase subunit B [Gammaproteobacteria bacterium]MBS02195.1 F0F1 ATP synthase subunit B [Gammaproteobacteria bacterium]